MQRTTKTTVHEINACNHYLYSRQNEIAPQYSNISSFFGAVLSDAMCMLHAHVVAKGDVDEANDAKKIGFWCTYFKGLECSIP